MGRHYRRCYRGGRESLVCGIPIPLSRHASRLSRPPDGLGKFFDGRCNGAVVARLDAFAQTGGASCPVAGSRRRGFDDGDGRVGYFGGRVGGLRSAFLSYCYIAHEVCVPLPIWYDVLYRGLLVLLCTSHCIHLVYRRALIDELADINEEAFELIKRDDDFFKPLIDENADGELLRILEPLAARTKS